MIEYVKNVIYFAAILKYEPNHIKMLGVNVDPLDIRRWE